MNWCAKTYSEGHVITKAHIIFAFMECTIEEQNNPSLYLEHLRQASCEYKSAIPVLLDFVATFNTTGDPYQLQRLSQKVLTRVCSAEKNLISAKEQLSQVVFKHLQSRHQIEDDIQRKELELRSKHSCIVRKEKEVKETKTKVIETKKRYDVEQNNYRALLKKIDKMKVGGVVVNSVCAGVTTAFIFATSGIRAPLVALWCQSMVAAGSYIAVDDTVKACDSARTDWYRSQCELYEHRKDMKELKKQCKNLQTEYNICVKDKSTADEKYNKVLHILKETTQFLESVFKCRQFVSVAYGKTEILHKSRKDYRFQNNLRLPLVEICGHLASTLDMDLFHDSGIQQLCINLKEQIAILPDSSNEDLDSGIDDYI